MIMDYNLRTMSDYDYESDYNEMEDVPFVQMELDIRVSPGYKALHHVEHCDFLMSMISKN